MVLVDVFVPSIDMTYDFQLNDTAPIGTMIEEIVEMVGQKEQTEIVGDIANLQLFEKNDSRLLQKMSTLRDSKISTGDTLILV